MVKFGSFLLLYSFVFFLFSASPAQGRVSSCYPNPCENNAKCLRNSDGSGYCSCLSNFVGDRCEYENPCNNQCQNGGVCNYSIGSTGAKFECNCPIGFTASLCEIRMPNACDIQPCHHDGTCQLKSLDSYQCICPAGFRGRLCDEIDQCASSPCFNGAKCENTRNGYKCYCKHGWKGETCTEDIDECAASLTSLPCVRGQCLNLHGSYRCECPEGYTGHNCESIHIPCDPSPCLNRARCVKYGHYKYHCECAPGFTGRHCEVNIDDCTVHKCENGATCIDGLLGYECKCTDRYKGEFCTDDVNECSRPDLCQHGGTCVNTDGGSHCICVNGWEGPFCQINKDDCAAATCYNGGKCIDKVGGFECKCPAGKTGLLCHLDDACVSNPCQAGAICDTNPVDGSYECNCPRGFTGIDCAKDVDECLIGKKSPCEHGGTCLNTPGSYTCLCPPGWTGGWCDVNINECASDPCRNNATCLDDVGRFICVCMPGFTGQHCEINLHSSIDAPCAPNPCLHNGQCKLRKNGGFECVCDSNYHGSICESRFDACLSSPCLHNGSCILNRTSPLGYSCLCRSDYSGTRCEHHDPECPCKKKVDTALFNSTDEHERMVCRRNRCDLKSNNGVCNPECNYFICNYDGGDCSAGQRPFAQCAFPSYCHHVFHNGHCDPVCNNEHCLFDGYDCHNNQQKDQGCNPIYRNYCIDHFGNGKCDAGCNNTGCGFDGGDCAPVLPADKRRSLSGDVVVVLLTDPATFLANSNRFLMTVGKVVRATIKIKTDEEGRLRIYHWNSVDGLGSLVTVDAEKLRELASIGRKSKRSLDRLQGVLVVMSVDVTDCMLMERADCFSDVLKVAAYLGAAQAKQELSDLGMAVYEAYGRPQNEAGQFGDRNPWMVVVIGLLCLLAVCVSALMVMTRKRTINAPLWIPPAGSLPGETSKVSSISGLNLLKNGDHSQSRFYNPQQLLANNYETNDYYTTGPKRQRRLGPEGLEDPGMTSLNAYLAIDNVINEQHCNYENDSIYFNGLKSNTLESQQRKWTREHEIAAGKESLELPSSGDINVKGPGGQTPAMIALNHRSDVELTQTMTEMISNGARIEEISDDGDPTLIIAVKNGRTEAVRIMLTKGADINVIDERGNTPLHHALLINHKDIVKMLLDTQRCDIEAVNYSGQTALILAAKISHYSTDCIQLLLARKPDVNAKSQTNGPDSDRNDGKTALHWAATMNNVALMELLLRHGANKDIQDNKDETPLFLAAREGNLDAVQTLMLAGAGKEIADNTERWPRDVAAINGHSGVVELLARDEKLQPILPAVGRMPNTATLQHPKSKPRAAVRRSRSVREQSKEKKIAQQQQEIYQQQLNHSTRSPHLISPESVPIGSNESPYSTATPSPHQLMNGQMLQPSCHRNDSVHLASASSCMMSPYSEPHSAGSTSGLSPPQTTQLTKEYRSPPPYSVSLSSNGWSHDDEKVSTTDVYYPPMQQQHYPSDTYCNYPPTYSQQQQPYCHPQLHPMGWYANYQNNPGPGMF